MGYIFSIRHVILEFPVFIYVSKLPLNITCFADFNGDLCRYVTTEPQYTRAFHPEKRDEFLVSLVAMRIPLYLTHSLSFFRCQLSVHENKEQQQQQLGILLVFEQTARRAAPRGAREQSGASSLVEGRPPAVADCCCAAAATAAATAPDIAARHRPIGNSGATRCPLLSICRGRPWS